MQGPVSGGGSAENSTSEGDSGSSENSE